MSLLENKKIILEFQQVNKKFGQLWANKNISFKVEEGAIHALVGENGAGKSTIMKILFGMIPRTSGEILLHGSPLNIHSPIDARNYGIGMVHQHFMLAGALTAIDHILLEDPPKNKWSSFFMPKNRRIEEMKQLSEAYQMPIPWDQPVKNLSVGLQQRLEILKLLAQNINIFIFDEPTALLSPHENDLFYKKILDLKAQGKTVLLITHKLKDVFKYADDVSIFKLGECLVTHKVKLTNIEKTTELMIGHSSSNRDSLSNDTMIESQNLRKKAFFEQTHQSSDDHFHFKKNMNIPEISIESLTVPSLNLKKINLEIHQGQIFGIAGIEGNGQSELIKFLMNPNRYKLKSGKYLWKQVDCSHKTTSELRALGLRYIPEDRLNQGSLPKMSLVENYLLGLQNNKTFTSHIFLHFQKIEKFLQEAISRFDIRPPKILQNFEDLSGGNQQKMVVARELSHSPQFLIAAQPCRGVDLLAAHHIKNELLRLKSLGLPILLISSDLDELLELSDILGVIFQGKIQETWKREDFDEKKIGSAMIGGFSRDS